MFRIRRIGGATGVALALALAAPARAQEAPPPPPPEQEKPSNEKPAAAAPTGPRITAHAYEEETTAEKAEKAERAIGDVLGADGRFAYKPFLSLLEPTDDVPR